ncbi:MAG: metallophosphoesterase [Eubacteriales bacterium]|nr:metallophosphoesterase [Eubacteriales bacterium]
MSFLKLIGCVFLCAAAGMTTGCAAKTEGVSAETQGKEAGLEQVTEPGEDEQKVSLIVDEKEIIIPDISGEYKIVFANDQHIIVPDGAYAEENNEVVQQRYDLFCDSQGMRSGDTWPTMVQQINQLEPDGVVLDGDMIDFYSDANMECLMKEVKNINYPTMYIRADHDLAVWYSDGMKKKESNQKHKDAWEMEDIMLQDYEEFMLVGINNNTSQLSEKALKSLKEIWKTGKPVILAMHVPLKSQISDELSIASKEVWQDRALLWGEGCYYEPTENTQQFLDMVYAEDSPVVAVIAAHLHFPFEDQLNENIRQIVFDASYKGMVGLVTVKGDYQE